jgi:DNA-binding MarR family transcriptional regulator
MSEPIPLRRLDVNESELQRFRKVLAEMQRCFRERSQYEAMRFGLPAAELDCLLLIGEERYVTPKDLAKRLNVAKSRVSKIVSGLVSKEMALSVRDPKDQRVHLLSLTSKGRGLYTELLTFKENINRYILADYAPHEREALLDMLEVLFHSMQSAREILE